ncbi:MAG TPA: FxSxx-COOH system tetratricopeptide repeat protein [Ktedonobacteraceae bacterium]|nr:FxSxx-COOH system tetratricopeptide repeat protein [Ktedonobacteraceae bacterium]
MVKKAAQATPNRLLRVARKERGWTQQQIADRIGAPLALNISRWENGTAFPSAYYLEKLCHLFGKNARELGLLQLEDETQNELASANEPDQIRPQQDPRMWTVPYPRNLFFLGREEVLVRLRHQLLAAQTMDLSHPQAISGLGGIGKTHIVLEYAYRHAQDYQAIFWVRADNRDTLVAGFLEIAHTVNLPEGDERDQSIIVTAVKGWLSHHTDWLLILDNADDLSILPEFLPTPMRGHLLLTTRALALGGLANRIEVHALDQDVAALLVLRRAALLAPDASLPQAERADQQAAAELARQLGGLPLALDQAGAYLEETGCGLQYYLDLYKSHRVQLLHHRGGWVLDHPDSVATTWSLSFVSIEQCSAVAADVLRVCSLLHPDAIPEELFLQGAARLGPTLVALEADPLAFNNALAVIQSYSLLRRNSREQTLSMHRVVQAVLTDAMSKQERGQWTERAIAALNALFPEVRHQSWGQWGQCDRLLPHVLTVAESTATQQHHLELAPLLTKTADYLLQRAQYQQAEPLYQRALALCEQMPSSEHPQVAFPLNGLADLYREQGHYEQAEPLYQRALSLWETLGPEHPEIPSALNNLALLYWEQSKHEQAMVLLQRDLHHKEQTLGILHPELASPLNNLAIFYCQLGCYEQAEPLLQRALLIDEQTFGKTHPEVSFSLTNLGCLYLDQGRYKQAEPLLQRALHIREQTLGPEHLQVSFPLNDLGDLYREQGRYTEAEPLYQRALSIREQILGSEHPQVAFSLNGLATLYREQGHYEQAEALYRRALALREQRRGAEHPEMAETLYELARLYELWSQPQEALAYYQQALAIREQRLGEAHPYTRATRTRYAHLLRACGRTEEAAVLEEAPARKATT